MAVVALVSPDSTATMRSPSPSTALAPGFRFHPTDEELVSYYLKRKIRGRRFRFDPIADVDLYKLEPWDLPARSRIQSRDQGWYFFSPLDRKNSKRSRTNRATAAGYWKTTGKDRPVVRRLNSTVVGVKKTLVFHSGRAPNGQRTNWVMHEYRLEDVELAREGIPQDTYVVCRIFQKKATGSQNGAQKDAPFVEEEWEESDEIIPKKEGEYDEAIGSESKDYLQLVENVQDLGIQHEAGLLLAQCDRHVDGGDPEDSYFLDDNLGGPLCGAHKHVGIHEQWADLHLFDGIGENTDIARQVELLDKCESQVAEFLQHHDIAVSIQSHDQSMSDSVTCPDLPLSNQKTSNEMHGSGDLPDVYNFDEPFEAIDKFVVDNFVCQPVYQQMCPAGQNDICSYQKDSLSSISTGCYTGKIGEENENFYEASSSILPHVNFEQMNDMLEPLTADSCGFNMLDDLMEYYEATDDKLHYVEFSSLQKLENTQFSDSDLSNSLPENNGGNVPISLTSQQDLGANVGHGMVSAENVLQSNNLPSGVNQDNNLAPDAQRNEVRDGPLMKHLTDMLNSFSAPPAFAAEFPPTLVKPTAEGFNNHLTRLINDTNVMVQVGGPSVKGIAKDLSSLKGSTVFLLSGATSKKNVARTSGNNKQITKVHMKMVLRMLRAACYLIVLLALIFTSNFKIGILIRTR